MLLVLVLVAIHGEALSRTSPQGAAALSCSPVASHTPRGRAQPTPPRSSPGRAVRCARHRRPASRALRILAGRLAGVRARTHHGCGAKPVPVGAVTAGWTPKCAG